MSRLYLSWPLFRRGFWWVLLLGGCLSCVRAAIPTADHLYPVAMARSSTNLITLVGKSDPWPPQVWVDVPDILFQAETNVGKFTVILGSSVPPGPHLFRLYNSQGASEPRFLWVTENVQTAEKEPNDDFRKPQALPLPTWLNGRLDKGGDVDSYAFHLEAGQTVVARVQAYILGSPLDAALRLIDTNGLQLAFNHDDGKTFDPLLTWQAKTAGDYILQVFGFPYPATSEVQFAGGNAYVYRLHLTGGPMLHHTLPLGVQRGTNVLAPVGWNLPTGLTTQVFFDGSTLPASRPTTLLNVAGFEETPMTPVSPGPELLRPATTSSSSSSTNEVALAIPSAVTACLGQPNQPHRYSFSAGTNDLIEFVIQSAWFGFPLDARLRILDGKGKELARADDQGNADPTLSWTSPGAGDFFLVVESVLNRGGPEFLYRLVAQRGEPDFQAILGKSSVVLEPGNTNDLALTLEFLHRWKGRLDLQLRNAPEGVQLSPQDSVEKAGAMTLKISCPTNAPPFNGPVQVVVREKEGGREHLARFNLISKGENNGVPSGFSRLAIESTETLWLTVTPKPEPKP